AGLLLGRASRSCGSALAVGGVILVLATFIFGPARLYDRTNSVLVISMLIVLITDFIRHGRRDEDFVLIRRGLLAFAGSALWENIFGIDFPVVKIETIGFAVFLACLGFVAARRTLQREQQLSAIQKEL